MELKTKFNPGDVVHFMFENKIATGEIEKVYIQAYVNKDQPVIKISYEIKHKYKVKVDTSGGFTVNQDENRERYFNLIEDIVFPNKEELIKNL